MRAIDYSFAIGDFVDAVYENRAFTLELLHYKAVMDYLLADINRRTEGFKSDTDDVNSANYPGTKSSGLQ